MVTLIDNERNKSSSYIIKYSLLIIVVSLYFIDKYLVRKDGDHIIIGDTALTVGDLFILFFFALALVALLRPMEHKNYHKKI